jgi:hypothetical protein
LRYIIDKNASTLLEIHFQHLEQKGSIRRAGTGHPSLKSAVVLPLLTAEFKPLFDGDG